MPKRNLPEHVPNQGYDATSPYNELLGHGTRVEIRPGGNGEYVQKTVRQFGDFHDNPEKWMEIQQHAKRISDEVRARRNPAYKVPKTIITRDLVREQVAPGLRAVEFRGGALDANSDWIMPALAHFVNDMSELRPVKHLARANKIRHLSMDSVGELYFALLSAPVMLKPNDMDFICDVFRYLRDLPENQEMIFAHGDLHTGNIMVDTETKTLSIIDFEGAKYYSKLILMYHKGLTADKSFWNMVNKLPRKTNPGLTWDWDANKHELFLFIARTIMALKKAKESPDKKDIALRMSEFFTYEIRHARYVMGRIRARERNAKPETNIMTIVPKSHYQK